MKGIRCNASENWPEPRLGRLCEVAAAAISPGKRKSASPFARRVSPCPETRAGTPEPAANKFKVVEVDAFASVHDMIHAAIASYGTQATLREIYRACQQQGRIAYKRSGGSRLITHNDHWKSQIRHALYTCDRFARAEDAHDLWTVSAAFSGLEPQTTKVLVRTDPSASCVTDDTALAPRQKKQAAPSKARAKHVLEEPVIASAPRQKRSRLTRANARQPVEPAGDSADEEQSGLPPAFLNAPSGSVAVSNKPPHHVPSSDYSDVEERPACASAFQPYAYDTNTTSTPLLQHEGEDESSHNDTCVQVSPDMYTAARSCVSYEPAVFIPGDPHRMHSGFQNAPRVFPGFSHMPVMDVHPYFTECLDAHQIVAESTIVCPPQATPARVLPAPYQAMHTMPHPCNGYSNAANSIQSRSPHLLASPHPQKVAPVGNLSTISPATPHQVCQSSTPQSNTAVLSQHPYMLHQTAAQHPSPSDRLRAAARRGTKRAPSVEADSPAEPQVYSLRSRLAHRAPAEHVSPSRLTQCHGNPATGVAVATPHPQAASKYGSAQPCTAPSVEREYTGMRSSSPLSSPSVNLRTPVSPACTSVGTSLYASCSTSPAGLLMPATTPTSNRTHLLLAAAQKAQADDCWPRKDMAFA